MGLEPNPRGYYQQRGGGSRDRTIIPILDFVFIGKKKCQWSIILYGLVNVMDVTPLCEKSHHYDIYYTSM